MKILLCRFIDLFWWIVLTPACVVMRITRRLGIGRMPLSSSILNRIGVFPIINHYYEPQFDGKFDKSLNLERSLPGLKFNSELQIDFLSNLNYAEELDLINKEFLYDFNNDTFKQGDADYWYQIIRKLKPKRIFEIGSGNSTRMAILAINKNILDNETYTCRHVCIEPYEMPWLEKSGVEVVRKKVEEVGVVFFEELSSGDILFIDSSHIIRPQGDVLFEYLELMPTLKPGVIVHIHDIFTPRNYLTDWLVNDRRFWNEQYLLEAFLSNTDSWEIIGALNYLKHNHFELLRRVAPTLSSDNEPGSIYIRCVK